MRGFEEFTQKRLIIAEGYDDAVFVTQLIRTPGNYSPRMRRWRTCNHGCGLCQSFADGSEGAPAVAAAGFDN
jgi:hypothetical protein